MKVDGSNATQVMAKKSTQVQQGGTFGQFLDKIKARVTLPINTIGIDRFMESVKSTLTDPKTPQLLQCSHESIIRSVMAAANYGLEIGGVLGQAYLIPYNENVNGQKIMTCHFQLGYKGLIALARRSNTIKTIAAECIYENDFFDCELASGRSIHHKIDIFKDRGEVVGYYCLVELTNGGEQFAVMSKSDAEKFRDKYSKSYTMAYDKSSQNWAKNFDAMALKTCVVKALKLCPISVEALRAVQTEELNNSNVDIPADNSIFEKDEAIDVEVTYTDETESKKRGRPAKKINVVEDNNLVLEAMSDQDAEEINKAFDSIPTKELSEVTADEAADIF